MCQYLDPACFMANVFAECSTRTTTMTFTALRQVRDQVTERLSAQNVVIEWTRDAVLSALDRYPNLFTSTGPEVTWQKPAEETEAVARGFSCGFSEPFLGQLRQTVQDVCREVAAA